jgi:ATP-dependent DNA ligase
MSVLQLPFQPPIPPMLSSATAELPEGPGWLYEPKWDGFRALVFFDGAEVYLQSRDCKPLGRYFPELVQQLAAVTAAGVVLDGEIVIAGPKGLDFEALLLRIHPAASRIAKLAAESPASFVAFDILADAGQDLRNVPQGERRGRLERVLSAARPPLFLTPATQEPDTAREWFQRFEGAGLDGVIAKRAELPYLPEQRVMYKLKHRRTADCVVGGFRWAKDKAGTAVGSLLLGLYDEHGTLQHVGHTSSFKAAEKRALVEKFKPYRDEAAEAGFGRGRTPGAPSRWSQGKDLSWEPLRPELVCEVTYDHLQGDRFRHGTTFARWRPDKPARECTFAQLETAIPYELAQIFAL